MSWHADRETIEQYLAGRLTEAYACSVEAHLLTCEMCRHELATVSIGAPTGSANGPADVRARVVHEQTWDRLLDEVQGIEQRGPGPVGIALLLIAGTQSSKALRLTRPIPEGTGNLKRSKKTCLRRLVVVPL